MPPVATTFWSERRRTRGSGHHRKKGQRMADLRERDTRGPLKASPSLAKPLDAASGLSPIHGLVAGTAVLLLGSALRLYGLDRQSAWADEITTLLITDPALTFTQFWHLALSDVHPPLYYLLLRFWSAAFGQSDLVARLPSAIFGILTVAVAGCVKPLPGPGRISFMVLLVGGIANMA